MNGVLMLQYYKYTKKINQLYLGIMKQTQTIPNPKHPDKPSNKIKPHPIQS